MTNHEIADIFELLSKLMDIHGANSFQSKSYSSAAFKIEKLPTPLAEMSAEARSSIPGIGSSIAAKIEEILTTNKLSALDEILSKTPVGILDIMKIKGLGPKKIALLWNELGVESIGELEYACQENRLTSIKGFGEKMQNNVLQSIAFIRQNAGFMLYAEAELIVDQLKTAIQQSFPTHIFEVTGPHRRQMPTLGSIDFVSNLTATELKSVFREMHIVSETANVFSCQFEAFATPINIYSCTTENVGSVLFKTTPEKDNVLLAFAIPDNCAHESEIFQALGLPFIPPAIRENIYNKETMIALSQKAIIQSSTEIKGVIHCHSTYSDGKNTLKEMALAAIEKGYEYMIMSDHSQAAFYANGLSPERIRAQHAEIDILNQELAPFKIFKSIEADILNDGQLDYNDEVLQQFDIVIASVHSNLKMSEEKAMSRLLTAIANPYTRILGHPTGRLLLAREGYPIDHKAIIDACIAHKVVIEINANPKRLDLDWTWIHYALEKGAILSINPDAHSINGIDVNKYGVLAAQKGGLTTAQNLSSYSLSQIEQFLQDKK